MSYSKVKITQYLPTLFESRFLTSFGMTSIFIKKRGVKWRAKLATSSLLVNSLECHSERSEESKLEKIIVDNSTIPTQVIAEFTILALLWLHLQPTGLKLRFKAIMRTRIRVLPTAILFFRTV